MMSWGRPGRGHWITVFSNKGHAFLVVAKLRFDTGFHSGEGARWSKKMRPDEANFTLRHPDGL
jgi:hypothetical protein